MDINIDTSIVAFYDFALDHHDLRITSLSPELIDHCKRVLGRPRPFLVSGMKDITFTDYMKVYLLHYYATRPDTTASPCTSREHEMARINGLILHVAFKLSADAPQIERYLAENSIIVVLPHSDTE